MDTNQGRLPVQIFVGVQPPEHWARLESSGTPHPGALAAAREGRRWERPALARPIPWDDLGVVPRFVGTETTSCVAALEPSIFHGQGAQELDRFLGATARRGETALIVSSIGDPAVDVSARSVLFGSDAHVALPGIGGSIVGRRLPAGTVPRLGEGLGSADRDLALRLQQAASTWWAVELQATVLEGHAGREMREPGGYIQPLLTNELGETLAGVWLPDQGRDWRWYIVPGGTDWQKVIAWVVDRAVPEFVPTALRRLRSGELVDDELLTAAELAARDTLAAFDREQAAAREQLVAAHESATAAAAPLRHDLLYGTGTELKAAVARLLGDAGFVVEDLDETFGSGKSADLLASLDGRHCLVEVKSAGGMPSEGLIDDVDRHVRTWSALGRCEAIHRAILVVNHQHKLPPLDRSATIYARPEFLATLQYAVVSTLGLFGWWRDGRRDHIVDAFVHGAVRCHPVDLSRAGAAPTPSSPEDPPAPVQRRPWWRRGPRPT